VFVFFVLCCVGRCLAPCCHKMQRPQIAWPDHDDELCDVSTKRTNLVKEVWNKPFHVHLDLLRDLRSLLKQVCRILLLLSSRRQSCTVARVFMIAYDIVFNLVGIQQEDVALEVCLEAGEEFLASSAAPYRIASPVVRWSVPKAVKEQRLTFHRDVLKCIDVMILEGTSGWHGGMECLTTPLRALSHAFRPVERDWIQQMKRLGVVLPSVGLPIAEVSRMLEALAARNYPHLERVSF